LSHGGLYFLHCALSRGTSDPNSIMFQGILPEEVSWSASLVFLRLIEHKDLLKSSRFELSRTAVPSQD
jgi:hypothetical protein